MRVTKSKTIFLVLVLVLSSFTQLVSLADGKIAPIRPEDKISDGLLNLTSSPDEIDVLVSYDDSIVHLQKENALTFIENHADVIEIYEDLNMLRVKIIGTSLLDFAKIAFVTNIWPNEMLSVKPMDTSNSIILADEEYESIAELVGARDLWDRGYNGSGIIIAVLDTGIDTSHPDLDDFDDNSNASKVATYASFVEADSLPTDILGSGTYAASVAAGTGNASAGYYSGIAPGATLLAGKVTLGGLLALPSWIVSGIEWASSNGADIILLPFNTFGAPGDAVAEAVKSAVMKGIFVIAAAGDDGPDYLTIMSPGGGMECFTVGAYDSGNQEVPAFSGRGPSLSMNTKPDLVAPGVGIVGARIGSGLGGFGLGDVDMGGIGGIGDLFGGGDTGENVDDDYKVLDSTAAAASIVAGAAAILMQAFDRATPIVLGNVLRDTATLLPYGANDAGAGLLNLPAAFDYISTIQTPIETHERSTGSALLALGFLSASGNNASSILMMSNYGTSTLVMDSRSAYMDIHMLMGTLYLKWNDNDPTSLMNFNVKREMHGVTMASLTGLLGSFGGVATDNGTDPLGGLGDLGGLLGGGDESGYGRWVGILSYEDEIFVTLVVESYNFTVNSTLPLTAFKVTPFILNMGMGVVENVSLYLSYSLDIFGDEEDDHGKFAIENQMLFAYGQSEDYRNFFIGINSSRDLDAFEVGNASDISSHITDDNLTSTTTFDGEVGLGMKWDFGTIYPNNPVNVSIAMAFGENRTVLDASVEAMWTANPPSSYANAGDFILVEAEIPRNAEANETYRSRAIFMNIGVQSSDAMAAMIIIKDNNGTGTMFAKYFTFDEVKPFHAEIIETEWSPEKLGIHTALWIATIGLESITNLLSDLGALSSMLISMQDDIIQRDLFVVVPIPSASVFPNQLPFGPFDIRFPTDFGMYNLMISSTIELGNLTVEKFGNADDWGNMTLTSMDSVSGYYNFSLFLMAPPINMDGYHWCDYVLETDQGWTTNITLERNLEYPRAMMMLDTSHGGGFGALMGDAGGFGGGDLGGDIGGDLGGFPAFALAQDDDDGGLGADMDMSDLGSLSDIFDSIRMTTFSGLSEMKRIMGDSGLQLVETPGMELDSGLLSQFAAVFMFNPTEEFNSTDIEILTDFSANGGKLIIFGDYEDKANLTGLNPLLLEYGYFMAGEHSEDNTTEIVTGSNLGTGIQYIHLNGGTFIYNNQSQASVRLDGNSVVLLDDTEPEIAMFGSSTIFMNKNLVKCNNSILLDNLIVHLLQDTLTCETSLSENTTHYPVGKSVYLNLNVEDYYGEPVDDLFIAIAFELPNGSLRFFIAGFVENGLYSSQFMSSYWSSEGTINGIFIILRDEYSGTYASITFELYVPEPDITPDDEGFWLTMVDVAWISAIGIFGALFLGLYINRSRRSKRYRIPEIDKDFMGDIDTSLSNLLATVSQMQDLIGREDLDRIQKIETLRGLITSLEKAMEGFEKVSNRVGGV
ncbi:MAG: S8 family serine peptidase [Candidatus Thorarchaeota archaeon]